MRVLALFLALLLFGCNTYREHLVRGQRYYQENKYEQALAIWRVLELDMEALSSGDQARYAYLRGMTDYRLGYRADARHWLAIARAIEKEYPGGLSPDWQKHADSALADLNQDVFGTSLGGDADEKAPGPATEGFEPVKCGSDADCQLSESCVAGVCQKPE